jgi:hypothetical protein
VAVVDLDQQRQQVPVELSGAETLFVAKLISRRPEAHPSTSWEVGAA